MKAIWRPTVSHDIGVDGQIEFLELTSEILSTGRVLAVQVKSGPSWFDGKETATTVTFYPKPKHRRYWRVLNLPVIIVLHDPTRDLTIYANVKPQLAGNGPIVLKKTDRFGPGARDALLAIADEKWLAVEPRTFLDGLKSLVLSFGNKKITGVEFFLACVHPEREYFELRMCRFVELLSMTTTDGVSVGANEFDFVFRCTQRILAYHLTEQFVEEFDQFWYDLQTVPDLTVQLTGRGVAVREYLLANASEYVSVNSCVDLAEKSAQEVAMTIMRDTQAESDRFDRLDKFGSEPIG